MSKIGAISIKLIQWKGTLPEMRMTAWRRGRALRKINVIKEGLIKDRTSIYISVWHLDDETRVIAMEGEISTEYSLLLKKMFPGGRTITGKDSRIIFALFFPIFPTRAGIGKGLVNRSWIRQSTTKSGLPVVLVSWCMQYYCPCGHPHHTPVQ